MEGLKLLRTMRLLTPPTLLMIQVLQIAKKNKNWTMDQMKVMKIVNRKMKSKEQIIKIKMKTLQTLPKLFPREKKNHLATK